MSSKNIISDDIGVVTGGDTTFIVSNNNIVINPARKIEQNPKVGIKTGDSSSNIVFNIRNKKQKNYILEDGPQYDDDELLMNRRGGRINRKQSTTTPPISTIDEIRNSAEEVGLVGDTNTPIIQLSNPNIDFLILIYPTKLDSLRKTNGLLVTGTNYYEKLKIELKNKNPYSYNIAFDDRFIVKLILKDWIDLFKNMQLLEEELGVSMIRNNFIGADYSIDYNQLIGFIDWFVSKPDYTNFLNKGVVSAETLSIFEIN